jgi:hypothetical protein
MYQPKTKEDYAVLVDQAAQLAVEVNQKTEELRGLKVRLAELAEFKEGKKTGHITGNHFQATVSLKENVKWDQKALESLRSDIGDEEFFKIFKWTFEPHSKKVLDGAMDFGPYKLIIAKAFTVSPGSPQVTFKPMEDF